MSRPDNGGQTGGFHDTEGDSQYLRDLPNYNSSSEVSDWIEVLKNGLFHILFLERVRNENMNIRK